MDYTDFEAVIGLEVHAQLKTKTKIFCPCSTEFNASTNSNICPVCAGHPGSLPVMNRKAVDYAIMAGLATDCAINPRSVFARKNYFYPDLPKGYQISQYDQPLCSGGHLDIEVGGTPQKPELAHGKRIRIQRIHMEEDAGKSVHMVGYSLVNLNRACTPLIEIVSEPDLKSSEEAGAYLRKLRAVLMYIDVCDGNMQEGSFRCDANVSVKLKSESKLGTRAEIKNVNSFRFVEKAIEYEISRQIQVITSGGKVTQETRTYDSGKGVTISMRSKEEAHDYRYFPEPDLIALQVTDGRVAQLKSRLAELPDQKRERFKTELGISAYDANVITASQRLAGFFESTVKICGEPKTVANWVTGELLRLLKLDERDVEDAGAEGHSGFPVTPAALGKLITMIKSGTISNSIAKTVFEEMYRSGADPEAVVKEKGLLQISDTSAIESVIEKVMQGSPTQLADYRSGKDKLFGFFVGQVMKQMAGKANPAVVNDLLKKKLAG